jgi:hypothetical protein
MAISGAGPLAAKVHPGNHSAALRRYHLSLPPQVIEEDPALLQIIQDAGVTDIWLAAFLYGRWYRTPEVLRKHAGRLEKMGFNVAIINVPLGHPGDALGVDDSTASHTPPAHWKNMCTADGDLYSGTSIHPPAVQENVHAVREIAAAGFKSIFLDDDFRLARLPGHIGGCFCAACRQDFIDLHGFTAAQWATLLESVVNRTPTPVLRHWTDYNCNKLYAMYTAMQTAAPAVDLGIMVMYLGAEKAGIPLDRFGQAPFRVGELMFDDRSFGSVKGKTDELFSALFHRRFARPDLAYSETTAFPPENLSARNMAAKLNISLLSDVRNTMFMSGLRPFPTAHWEVLEPAMQKNARLHESIAGHKPRGPFKHYWGWDSRLVGRDKPFSLFLAAGIPFEVVEEPSADGWMFLSDEDAVAAEGGRLQPVARNLVVRPQNGLRRDFFIRVEEDMDALFAFKKQITGQLRGVPYVQEDIPVVFAWYPTANAAVLWNLTEQPQHCTIRCDGRTIAGKTVGALDVELMQGLDPDMR